MEPAGGAVRYGLSEAAVRLSGYSGVQVSGPEHLNTQHLNTFWEGTMPRYIQLGQVPRKRHTQFRKPDGSLYAEQVFGTKGFSGIASILYHPHPPTRVSGFA